MAFKPLKYKHQTVRLRKPVMAPNFLSKTVLTEDPWDYVHLWLRRQGHDSGVFFWKQAQEFYDAARQLSPLAAPVPAYYSMLNAVKTLLTVSGQQFRHTHGVKGSSVPSRRSLAAENIELLDSGVVSSLCDLLGEAYQRTTFSLKTALYNLPWIHRAYTLTYRTEPELFIPITDPCFVTRDGTPEAWVVAGVGDKLASGHTTRRLPADYLRTEEENDVFAGEKPYIVRRQTTFEWHYGADHEEQNVESLTDYHREVRQRIMYIHGPQRLWYLKRAGGNLDAIEFSSLTLTISAMHRVSVMARYEPTGLHKHLEARHHNWLLTEFIEIGPRQFIDEVASEITGAEFMAPGLRK